MAELVRQSGFSGFGGLDVFEQSEGELPVVVEVNTRPTQSLQLDRYVGGNLVALFCQALERGQVPAGPAHHPKADCEVAFFPYEIMRDPASAYLQRIPMNTPWDDPSLLAALLPSQAR